MGWDNRPSNFAVVVKGQVKKVRNEAALFGLRGLVITSPVDTGRYRGSHVLSVGSVGTSSEGVRSPGQAIGEGISTVARADAFDVVFLTTTVDYADALEKGGSKQALNGVYGPTFNSMRVKYAV